MSKNPFIRDLNKQSSIQKAIGGSKKNLAVTKRPLNFWREYSTQCANCAKLDKHKSGFILTGMTPSGEMKTFCNADCCNEWEQKDDNTNSRREAIKAQRAKKKNDAPSR